MSNSYHPRTAQQWGPDGRPYGASYVPYAPPQAPYAAYRPIATYESPYAPPIAAPQPYKPDPGAPYDSYAPVPPYGGYSAESRPYGVRTPSPTPSEIMALYQKRSFDWRRTFSLDRENWPRLALMGAALAVYVAFSVEQDRIIRALQPAATHWAHDKRYGFLIPIGLIFVLSFPPLIGADFVGVLCGVEWGAMGCVFVIAGQLLGEVANYLYACSGRSHEKKARSDTTYAALERAIRQGGVLVAATARYSIIPTHGSAALFAACGMRFWVFLASVVLSLPKNLVNVYIGATFEAQEQGRGTPAREAVKYAMVGLTTVVTVVAMLYIDAHIVRMRPAVVYQRRKARECMMSSGPFDSSTAQLYFSPDDDPALEHMSNQYYGV
ncbi:hypothetical protein HWV62_34251 [Athelia sp. TMB]|nr:hypothetical protein HWV62_34251 [Athelia sp. TMB]